MIALDVDSLECDLAETYGIYDYRQLPITKVAVFSYGLRDDSRIKMKLSGVKVGISDLLIANVVDRLSLILYSKTKDAEKGKNPPKLITPSLSGDAYESRRDDIQGFNSSEEFEKMRLRIIEDI